MKKPYPLLSVIFLISICISQNKVNVNNLVKHGNKYFKENEYFPYDGIVIDISKETGNRTLQFRMIDGFKNGPYNEWYSNGKPKTTGQYLNDDSTNSWTKWYENGQIEIKGTYKDGKKDKSWTKWYENGQIEIESSFQNGRERGFVTEWYENGLRREERTFKQVLTYTEKGIKQKSESYKKLFTYYDNKNIKREKNYRNGEEWGLEILYHDNGNIKHKYAVYKKNIDEKTYLIFTEYDKHGKLIEGDETWWDGFKIKSGECYKDNEEVDCYVRNQKRER